MSLEAPERRFAFGRMVKSAAPPADVVQQILEQRAATKDADAQPDNAPDAHIAGEESNPQLEHIAEGLGQLFDLVVALHDQDSAENKAFTTLHAELSDYKNDFFYERLKPFARQLLFVSDALSQYRAEIDAAAKTGEKLPAAAVQSNVAHINDQLHDALALIEMAPVKPGGDEFDPKTQRAVEVEKVPRAQNNSVMREVRAGWTMGKSLLRPADVVVGKAS